MAATATRHINIIGHQNPDTDSICSALAYAWLKNRGSLNGLYEARRAGHVNRETRFVLQHFGVEAPRLCTDVSPQIKDIDIRKQAGIDGEMSVRAAWNLMRDVEIDTLCIVDEENELQGFTRSGQLEFLFLQRTSYTLHIYKTANGQVYKVPYHDPTLDAAYGNAENYGRPIALTGDGRVLVTDGYVQQDGSPADAYGLIDLDAYLSGSTDYTPVQMWQDQ